MRSYRVDLIDFQGQILRAEILENATDRAAIDIARNIFGSRRHYRSVEVWQQWRLIYHDRRSAKSEQPSDAMNAGFESSSIQLVI
jgi:hypothetical protein